MRDNQNGGLFKLVEIVGNEGFVGLIQRGGDFIEKQEGAFKENGDCQTEALAFTSGKLVDRFGDGLREKVEFLQDRVEFVWGDLKMVIGLES